MNKGTTRKIISTLVIALFLVETILPLQVYAGIATGSPQSTPSGQASAPLNYDNPNNGDNPFKPKVKDFINPRLLSQVVGCTGIVNKVSDKIVGAVNKVANKLVDKAKKKLQDWAKKQLAKNTKNIVTTVITGVIQTALGATTTTVVGTGTQLGTGAGKGIENIANRNLTEEHAEVPGVEKKLDDASEKQHEDKKDTDTKEAKKEYRENCLNGIAIQLAKNQLSAMTKYTMNWINTGFSGNSFYVNNLSKYYSDIENSILDQETRLFKDPMNGADYPYGRDFARGAISTQQLAKDFTSSMKQDLTNYLEPGATIEDFSNDFTKGGWSGWSRLTQDDKNNPLGFIALSTENISSKQQDKVENAKAELVQGQGYRPQQKCKVYETPAGPTPAEINSCKSNYESQKTDSLQTCETDNKTPAAINSCKTNVESEYSGLISSCSTNGGKAPAEKKCKEWETVTPGSAIAAKANTYLNTPERQLELVKTMNDALNALFTMLLAKFENQGLAGLDPAKNITTVASGGTTTQSITFDEDGYVNVDDTIFGTGSTPVSTTTGVTVGSGGNPTSNGGGATTGGGGPIKTPHTYIKDDGFDITKDLGNIYDQDGVLIKKGVIQNQYDYIDAMGIYKGVIADVLPALGELDYCIPGPNPNWRENSKEAIDEYLSTLNSVNDVGNVGNTIEYAPDGTYEYPQPLPDKPVKKKVSLLKRLSFIVNPLAGMNQIRKKFKEAKDYRNYEEQRAAIEADNERIRIKNEKIRDDMLAGKRPLDPIFIANTIGTDRDSILKMIAPENTGLDPAKLLATLDGFEEYIDATYGLASPMQNYWKGNTKYLPAAQEGLQLTKNIPDYIEEVEAAKNDSRDLLAEATPNLDKLKAIQKRVNEIIAAAQKRRADKIAKEGGTKISPTCLLKEKVTFTDYNGKIIASDDRPLPIIKNKQQIIKDYAPLEPEGTLIKVAQ
jgi:hypothetical protein